MELRQGKCTHCRVAYRWPANLIRLKDAYCPTCGEKLVSTTHLLQWPWVAKVPINSAKAYKIVGHF